MSPAKPSRRQRGYARPENEQIQQQAVCCAPNMRALWITFSLNTVFTITQLIGATASHSLALMGDTGTMGIDSLTYLINIIAEHNKHRLDARTARAIEIAASLFSAVALCGVTVQVAMDALPRLARTASEEVDVDPDIMLFFTIINLLMGVERIHF